MYAGLLSHSETAHIEGHVNRNVDTALSGIGTAYATLNGAGGLVEASVVSVDEEQTRQEGTTWESYDSSSVGGTGAVDEEDDRCRVEYKQEDGHNVKVYYGRGDADVQDWCDGTSGKDVFWMRAGDDTAYGYGDADQLHMGQGVDIGRGDEGPDELFGGAHGDQLYGADGADVIHDSENDSLDADYLSGGPGSDQADMEDGDTRDEFFGGNGRDPEPKFDKDCHESPTQPTGWGCTYDYFESAGGQACFPPDATGECA